MIFQVQDEEAARHTPRTATHPTRTLLHITPVTRPIPPQIIDDKQRYLPTIREVGTILFSRSMMGS